jgi:hypothetical protein
MFNQEPTKDDIRQLLQEASEFPLGVLVNGVVVHQGLWDNAHNQDAFGFDEPNEDSAVMTIDEAVERITPEGYTFLFALYRSFVRGVIFANQRELLHPTSSYKVVYPPN